MRIISAIKSPFGFENPQQPPKTRLLTDIKKIIIHGSFTNVNHLYTAENIDKDHRIKGYAAIGYHFVIEREMINEKHNWALVHVGRDIYHEGAHCLGHNHDSIGICVVGGRLGTNDNAVWVNNYQRRQRYALRNLLYFLTKNIETIEVIGYHCDFDTNRACPGPLTNMRYVLDQYRSLIPATKKELAQWIEENNNG